MRLDRFAEILLATGAIVGVVAVVGLAVGFEPSRLPPQLLDIAAYKLTFGAAALLLAIGAIVRRHTRDSDPKLNATSAPSVFGASDASAPAELPPAHHRDLGGAAIERDAIDNRIPRKR